MSDIFLDKAFDVEHALVMYASSFVTLPASYIYEDDKISHQMKLISKCHIYIIGLLPKVSFVGARQEGRDLITSMEVSEAKYDLRWPLPPGADLKCTPDNLWYVEDVEGKRGFPTEDAMMLRLSVEHDAVGFEVLYIGQAYGEAGSRSALDRLRKHETLQKIALKGTPDGYRLSVLMLAIEPANRVVTLLNPRAKDLSQGDQRISNGLDKLFGTNEAERTTLYEASLIRYFQPPFNKEFKNSFPSTNMKLLADCYAKDFSAVVAEICIDELPFSLFSHVVGRKPNHIAKHNLHSVEERNVFFTQG